MGDYRFKIGHFAPTGAGWLKISGRRGRPTNHSCSQKTRLNILSYDIKVWTNFSSVLSQSTRLTDERTDRILIARPRLHSMLRGNNKLSHTVTVWLTSTSHLHDDTVTVGLMSTCTSISMTDISTCRPAWWQPDQGTCHHSTSSWGKTSCSKHTECSPPCNPKQYVQISVHDNHVSVVIMTTVCVEHSASTSSDCSITGAKTSIIMAQKQTHSQVQHRRLQC